MPLNYVLFLSVLFFLLGPVPGTVLSGPVPADNSVPAQWEDPDYWVHIRNVSIFDESTQSLQKDMFVLVVGKHIHKIGTVPMMIFDKDLTFNYDGEGRILMIGRADPDTAAGNQDRSVSIREGLPANIWVIDVRTVGELSALMVRPEWTNTPQRAHLDAVLLILEDGWVVKDTLPRKHIDEFRLQKVKKKRKEKGLPIE